MVRVTFSYDPDSHPTLHNWIASLPAGQRSQEIRDALTAHAKGLDVEVPQDTQIGLILQAVERIEGHVSGAGYHFGGDHDVEPHAWQDPSLPPDIMANLEGLGE